MRILKLLLIYCLLPSHLVGQCLTDFTKLVPETSADYSADFGRSISMYDDFLAVGVPNSDSVGRITGVVYIYKKSGTKWIKNSAILPAVPLDGLQFGWTVKLSQDYLFVGASSQGGTVYVYRKNGVDWSNFSELAIWKVPDARIFGTSQNNPIGITADQNTIVITDIWHLDNSFPSGSTGAMYLYHKNISEEWSNASTPKLIPPPEVEVDDFGGGGVLFQGNRLATFTRFAPTGNGQIYIYKDAIGEFDNPTLEAKLAAGDGTYSYGFSFNNFAFTKDGIFLMASVDISTPRPKYEVVFFEQPQTGTWNDGYLTCHFDPDLDTDTTNWEPTLFTSSGDELFVSSRNLNNKGTLTHLKKGMSGWCNPSRETIEVSLPNPATPHRYGVVMTSNNNLDLTLGYVSHVATGITEVALKTFTKVASGWKEDYLYSTKKSTAGHQFGYKVRGVGDHLFVASPSDGTVKANAGAVYIYTKTSTGWSKTSKILPPPGGQYDDSFASNIATNGEYLAVAASGYEPSGKFFVYKKGIDWNNPQLLQTIDLKSDGLIVYLSGDNIALSQDWLVMPYMDSGSSGGFDECHIFLALYKFDGTQFNFRQSLCIQGTNFFARSSTVPVSIEGNVIVAGSKIVELNESGTWEVKYQLSPSEQEPIQFNSSFNIVSNGDRFGFSNSISNGSIFISAPTKDYNGTWDVGVVYVYTKLPNEKWSSRTESSKILPNVKEESGLFGYSLATFENTIIVGSPLSDYYKTGVPVNKPGKASIFQSKDYFWKETNWIADFTGDSHVKDYFGLSVHMDETDFFIGTPVEDLTTGKISGSVYMVPTPPIVKLVPPVCNSEGTFALLGYPFQGTWSGPGIVDASLGTFNPKTAGIGTHILTYQTPNCANTGILQIEVRDNPLTTILNGQDYLVCQSTTTIAINLEIQSQPDGAYIWYYRPDSTAIFLPLGLTTSKIVASKRGEYQVKATNICSSFSPVISIKNESLDLIVDTPAPSCNTMLNPIALTALPTGGVWTGSGVTNNQFLPSSLPAGAFSLTYSYSSALGCKYSKAVTAQVTTPFIPSLTKSGDICINGIATISLTAPHGSLTNVQWLRKDIGETNYTVIQNTGNSVQVNKNGTVKVITETAYCSPKEVTIPVNDSFLLNFSPTEESIKVCATDETYLSIKPSNTGFRIEWNYYETKQVDATIVNNEAQFKPSKTGYYFANVYSANCQKTTPPKYIEIQPADSVFIPNVFTPNDDGKNDKFKIASNDPSPSYTVFNRYGNEVFFDKNNYGWDGGDSPAGVYFWIASVANCSGERALYKGWVQLIR
ncbi:MAG: gliding motility-associated C-terminal domain-containing protein [Flammeovirgaceae bacterium]|jgi:gliding motility-associated-like protein|nr:gliding motility-associated C-terminal domain-containing protein [Flammeovirgaceae bacterium]